MGALDLVWARPGHCACSHWPPLGTPPFLRTWVGERGHHTIPCPPVPALPHYAHSPFSGAPGLTVTFLPELPARPTLAEAGLPAKGPSCPLSPSSHPTCRAATKTKEVMAFLCPLLLWGRRGSLLSHSDGKVLNSVPSLLSSPSFTLDAAVTPPLTKPPSPASLALSSGAAPSSWFILPPLSLLPPLSAYLAPALQLQPLGRSSPPSFSPSLPPASARCLLSVRLQSSPGDRRAMLKAFSQF